MVMVFESLVLSGMLVQPRIQIGIRPAHIADVERAVFMGPVERIHARGLLGDFAVDFRRLQWKWAVEAGFCHSRLCSVMPPERSGNIIIIKRITAAMPTKPRPLLHSRVRSLQIFSGLLRRFGLRGVRDGLFVSFNRLRPP